jgi:hypothetical protein
MPGPVVDEGAVKEPPHAVFGEPAKSDEAMRGFDDWEVGGRAEPASEKPQGPDDLFAILGDSMVPPAGPVEERPESGRVSQKGAAPPTSLPAEPSPLEQALRSLPASVSSQFWKAQREAPRIEEAVPEDGAQASSDAPDSPATLPTGADRDGTEAFVAAVSEPAAAVTTDVAAEKAPPATEVAADGANPAEATGASNGSGVGTTTAVSAVMALPAVEPNAGTNAAADTGLTPSPSPSPPNTATFPEPSNAMAQVIAAVSADEDEVAAEAPVGRPLTPPDGTPTTADLSAKSTVAAEGGEASAANAEAAEAAGEQRARVSSPEVELGDAVASAVGGEAPKTQPSSNGATPATRVSTKGVPTTPPINVRSTAGRGVSSR